MPKALIISYFFPPLSGPGVQRSYNFVRNLPDCGWEPVVLTVKDISYVARDENLLKELTGTEIYRTETLDPMRMLYLWERFRGKNEDTGIYVRVGKGVRQFWREIFPIDSKIGWLLTAVKEACVICRMHGIKVIFCTMSPYSAGILAYLVSHKMKIPYILDYRDLWQGKPDITYLSEWHRRLAIKWEKKIIQWALAIIHVTKRSAARFLEIYPECDAAKVSVIFNGYDRESLPSSIPKIKVKKKIKFIYAGNFYGDRNPGSFLNAVKELITENRLPDGVQFEFAGNYPQNIEEMFFKHDSIKRIKYMNYSEYLNKLIDSDILLLFISNKNSEMILTQKLFEYLAVRRPIFAMIPEKGEAAEIIRDFQAGIIPDQTDGEEIKAGILEMCSIIRLGKVYERFKIAENDYSAFERQVQAGQLAVIMDKVKNG